MQGRPPEQAEGEETERERTPRADRGEGEKVEAASRRHRKEGCRRHARKANVPKAAQEGRAPQGPRHDQRRPQGGQLGKQGNRSPTGPEEEWRQANRARGQGGAKREAGQGYTHLAAHQEEAQRAPQKGKDDRSQGPAAT